jgi:spore coat assembly protein SafA
VNKIVRLRKIILIFTIVFSLIISNAFVTGASAQVVKHTVVSGESMWKIAVKYQVGLSEIISANSQVKNPAMIYPGQVLNIPLPDNALVGYVNEVIRLTNAKRTQSGLPALKSNWQLSRVGQYKAKDMHDLNYFSHQSPTYGSPFDMMKQFGLTYRSAGENIAKGQQTPAAVVDTAASGSVLRPSHLPAPWRAPAIGAVIRPELSPTDRRLCGAIDGSHAEFLRPGT